MQIECLCFVLFCAGLFRLVSFVSLFCSGVCACLVCCFVFVWLCLVCCVFVVFAVFAVFVVCVVRVVWCGDNFIIISKTTSHRFAPTV